MAHLQCRTLFMPPWMPQHARARHGFSLSLASPTLRIRFRDTELHHEGEINESTEKRMTFD